MGKLCSHRRLALCESWALAGGTPHRATAGSAGSPLSVTQRYMSLGRSCTRTGPTRLWPPVGSREAGAARPPAGDAGPGRRPRRRGRDAGAACGSPCHRAGPVRQSRARTSLRHMRPGIGGDPRGAGRRTPRTPWRPQQGPPSPGCAQASGRTHTSSGISRTGSGVQPSPGNASPSCICAQEAGRTMCECCGRYGGRMHRYRAQLPSSWVMAISSPALPLLGNSGTP